MLHELTVENFALFERMHVRFGPGLNILTGETGAGKTIIIDAISRLLGSRGAADDVRSGAPRAHIEAVFWLAHPPVALDALLAELGLLDEATVSEEQSGRQRASSEMLEPRGRGKGLELIVSRDISASGRSVGRINGRAVPLHVLTRLGRFLVDIHGQTEHLSLLRHETQLHLLDRFAGLEPQRAAVGHAAQSLRAARTEWQGLQDDERELARRSDLLRYQADEVGGANLRPGEDTALQQERQLLANAAHLASAAAVSHTLLTGGDEQPGALDQLGEVGRQLATIAAIDPSLGESQRMVTEATALVEEVSHSLRSYADAVEFDPARLATVEERLELIGSLKRKYGDTIEAVLAYGKTAAQDLATLTRRDERLAELAAQVASHRTELGRQASDLSRARQRAATELAAAVAPELADLNLAARFEVALERRLDPDGAPWSADPTETADGSEPPQESTFAWDDSGIDTAQFRIAANPGEPFKAVARSASGGEMSRILLALKSVLSAVDRTPTLIFDEVDAGVGGRSGWALGQKLVGLSTDHQVLCVTHLPQMAVYGQSHCYIAKHEQQGRTVTSVRPLDEQERLYEIAQMLGGTTPAGLQRAREMLERARGGK